MTLADSLRITVSTGTDAAAHPADGCDSGRTLVMTRTVPSMTSAT